MCGTSTSLRRLRLAPLNIVKITIYFKIIFVIVLVFDEKYFPPLICTYASDYSVFVILSAFITQ
jgi:hypothetical protein